MSRVSGSDPAEQVGKAPPAGHPPQPGARPARKRRLRYVLLAVVVLSVLVVWLAPRLLSTGIARGVLVRALNGRVEEQVSIGEIWLSWLGPCGAGDVSAVDATGREVLKIGRISYPKGILGILADAGRLEGVEVSSPQVMIYLGQAGLLSASMPLTLKNRSTGRPAEMSSAAGTVVVKDGLVRIVRPDGRAYEMRRLAADVVLDAPGRVSGRLDFQTAGGGEVAARFDIAEAEGTFSISTARPVAVKLLSDFSGTDAKLAGMARLAVSGEVSSDGLTADFELGLSGLRSAAGGGEVRPIDLKLTGNLLASTERAAGSARLSGQAGSLEATFEYHWPDRPLGDWKELLAELLSGRSARLPDFSLTLDGQLDVAGLAGAAPDIVNVLPGVEIVSGEVAAEGVSLRGGRRPEARGDLVLRNLAARKDGRSVACRSVSLSFGAHLDEGKGPVVEKVVLSCPFAKVEGSGARDGFQAGFALDLAEMHEKLGQVFDLGRPATGRIEGRLEVAELAGGASGFSGTVEGRDFRYEFGDRLAAFQRMKLEAEGSVVRAEGKLAKLTLARASLGLDGKLAGQASGSYDFQTGDLQGRLELKSAEIDYLQEQAVRLHPGAGIERMFSGRLRCEVDLARAGADEAVSCTGQARLADLAVDGERLGAGSVGVRWSGGRFDEDGKRIALESLAVVAPEAELMVEDLQLALRSNPQATGRLRLAADLGGCVALAQPVAKWDKPPRIEGDLLWHGAADYADGRGTLTGEGSIKNLLVASEDKTVRPGDVNFVHRVGIDLQDELLAVEQFELASDMLSFRMSGTVEKFRSQPLLALAGSYEGSWERIMAVLGQFQPRLAETISLSGKTAGKISIAGRAHRPDVTPTFRQVAASAAGGWTKAELLDVPLGPASFTPTLADGLVTVPRTVVAAGAGKVRFGGRIDFRSARPVYRLPGKVKVLENLVLTDRLTREFLSRFNPVFAELTSVEGKVSLEVTDLELPLSQDIKRAGAGRGHLDVSKLNVQPKGVLKLLVELAGAGRPGRTAVTVSGVDFVVKEGRIHYDNFTMDFTEDFDLRFRGSVGFDDTLDLVVSVPVSSRLLARLGVVGPVADYARLLHGVRVEIPVIGTRQKPKLDFSKVDPAGLAKTAAELFLSEKAGRVLGDLLRVPYPAPTPTTTRPAPDPRRKDEPADLLLDSLLDLLQERNARKGPNPGR